MKAQSYSIITFKYFVFLFVEGRKLIKTLQIGTFELEKKLYLEITIEIIKKLDN